MRPYYANDLVTLYHGDCREIVRDSIPPACVDLLVTDPPYGTAFGGFRGDAQSVVGDGETEGFRLLRQLMAQARFALKPDAHAYVFCRWDGWRDFFDACDPYIPIQNALIWWKDRGGMGNLSCDYATDYEVILYGRLGARPLAGKRSGSVIEGIPPLGAIKTRHHPTEKPTALLTLLMAKSLPTDGVALDPFAGAGSTLVAAQQCNQHAIGIEIEERYCEIAAERLSQNVLLLGGAA